MRTLLLCAALASVALTGCTTYDDGYYGHRDRSYGDRGDYWGARDWGPDHDWATDYHEGNYEPYALGPRDRIYRGQDGRYYCHRSDGTVGLVVGAGVGAVLGNLIAPRGSGLVGALVGGTVGAAAGVAAEHSNQDLRCQ